MAGDRSGYRNMYPGVLHFTDREAQEQLKRGGPSFLDPDEYRDLVNTLAEDAQRIRDGVSMVPWPPPDNTMLDMIQVRVLHICANRLSQLLNVPEAQGVLADALSELGFRLEDWRKGFARAAEDITDEEFSDLRTLFPSWDEVFIRIPARRLQAAVDWKEPFDAIEAALSEFNYPVQSDDLDEMHTHITRGHNWFGVGEWNIANRHYLNALSIAIATNNCAAIEAILRFLVDTYVAAGDSGSAVNITNDFLDSAAYQASATKEMTVQMLEAIAVAFALARRLDKSEDWIKKIPMLCGRLPHSPVGDWNIVELLLDVYRFRRDSRACGAIISATKEMSRLIEHVEAGRAH